MRVLIINTSERVGGAAIAANRLMEALKKNGVKAKMLVRDKQTDQMTVVTLESSLMLPLKFLWERFCVLVANRFSMKNIFQVDIANTGSDITKMYEFEQADVIHLHWVNQGFLSMQDLDKIMHSGKPVVITMHDMWYFTGICHYSGSCNRYEKECYRCPLLKGGGMGKDLARSVYERKRKLYGDVKITFVGCSRWIADLARKSRLTEGQQVVNIPNAINTSVFHPIDMIEARRRRGLPADKTLILFGSQRITDERKGFRYLADACNIVKQNNKELAEKVGLVVLGSHSEKVESLVPFDVYPVNYLSNESEVMEMYNAVNLFVTPSLQDNLPNTIVEAMACGTPCVGFKVGGIPEMIDHLHDGYVADYMDAQDFAKGILWCLDEANNEQLGENAHKKAVETYSESRVARRYTEIYESMSGE